VKPGRGFAAPTHAAGVAFFETALGVCGVAWNHRGISGMQLPEARAAATRKRLRARFPDSHEAMPPQSVQQAMDAIAALLSGSKPDLSSIALDMEGVPDFDRRVYEFARRVPPGATTTYGAIAGALGEPGSARAVGQALARNPFPIVVPCHRVLATGGRLGGFSAGAGVSTKLKMLAIEGAEAASQRSLFD
jgi:methylated-DNA-[protein]-cysteine S-methyltransferase